MKFNLRKPEENIVNLVRSLGYSLKPGKSGEFNCLRPVSDLEYPRLHLFIKEDEDKLVFDLHLDQKKPSYSGNRAHSGEHEGKVVEEEVERIKKILES